LEGILDHAQRYVLSGPHTPAEAFRKSSSLRNLSGLFLIAFSALRSSASSTRSSNSRYSSMAKMTAVGFPPRITISGSFLFRLVFIGVHPSFHESTIVIKFLQMISACHSVKSARNPGSIACSDPKVAIAIVKTVTGSTMQRKTVKLPRFENSRNVEMKYGFCSVVWSRVNQLCLLE
jgi:hypothetical protein